MSIKWQKWQFLTSWSPFYLISREIWISSRKILQFTHCDLYLKTFVKPIDFSRKIKTQIGFTKISYIFDCEVWKFNIFCHSDFTWNQIWRFQKCKICCFNTFRGSEFSFLWIFAGFEGLKFTQIEMSKVQKWQKLHFLNVYSLQIWFHVKWEWWWNFIKVKP